MEGQRAAARRWPSQPLHRDGASLNAVAVLTFLDPYGPDNGATRVAPRPLDQGQPDASPSLTPAGGAGDILMSDADSLHGATRYRSRTRRRSLLFGFAPECRDASRTICGVRMDTGEVFVP